MREKKEKTFTREKAFYYSYEKIAQVLISTGIIIAFLFFISPAFAQKRPEDVEATDFVLDLVALYLNVEEIEEAMDILEKLSSTFPEDYDVRLYLGIALCKKQDYEAAFKEFHKIEKTFEFSERIRHPQSLSSKDRIYVGRRGRFAFSLKNKGLLYFGKGITLLMSKADFKTARKKFISALKAGYDEINVRYLLIYSYLKLKNYKKADKELNNLLEKKEMNEVDYFIKGYLSYKQGLENEAFSLFKKAMEINPNLPEAKKNLASIYYNKGEWEKAVEMWSEVLEEIPEDFKSKLNTARAYFHLGRLEEAKKQFETLNISMPVKDYSPKKIPLTFIPWQNWAKFNVKYQVDYEALFKRKNLEKLKQQGIGPSRLAAVFLNEKAIFILRKEGRIEEAIKILNLAREIDETGFFISYNVGQLYLNSGNLKKAKECALQSIQHKKDFLEVYDLLGNIYFKQGKYEEALKEFKREIEISATDAYGHYNLGCAYWALKDFENAEEEWKKAIEYDRPMAKKEKDKKYTRDGWSFSLIVREKPVAYRAHISLGSLYEAKRLIQNTIREYERAVKIEPDNPEAYFELGRIYFDEKSWQKTKFYLKKHINLGGQNQEKAKKLLNSLRSK